MKNDAHEEAIKEHYRSRYGDPSREARFVTPGRTKIEIWKWDAEKNSEGVVLYATIGGFRGLRSDHRRACEFYFGILPTVDDVAEAMAEVAIDGNGQGTVPQSGDSITLSFPLWKRTEMTTFLFRLQKESDVIPRLELEHLRIDFIKLVPVFKQELEFKQKYGETALWDAFAQNATPYWKADRDSTFAK